MYNSQEIATRIKETAKKRGVVIKTMLSDLEINVNTISMLAKGREISYMNFAKIADYLNCSVDYLLCKTDEPNGSGDNTYYGDNNGFQANRGTFNISSNQEKNDSTTEEFIQVFKNMDLADRVAVMQFAFDKMKKGA